MVVDDGHQWSMQTLHTTICAEIVNEPFPSTGEKIFEYRYRPSVLSVRAKQGRKIISEAKREHVVSKETYPSGFLCIFVTTMHRAISVPFIFEKTQRDIELLPVDSQSINSQFIEDGIVNVFLAACTSHQKPDV